MHAIEEPPNTPITAPLDFILETCSFRGIVRVADTQLRNPQTSREMKEDIAKDMEKYRDKFQALRKKLEGYETHAFLNNQYLHIEREIEALAEASRPYLKNQVCPKK